MAPSRGKGKGAVRSTAQTPTRPAGRSARGREARGDGIDDIYQSMLAEAIVDDPSAEERPLKRRRTGAGHAQKSSMQTQSNVGRVAGRNPSSDPVPDLKRQQTVEDSSESDGSEFEFEDVDLGNIAEPQDESVDGIEDLSISVQPESSSTRASRARRKPTTTIEKAHRLLVHKLHVLCLLGHCMFVNGRCNNKSVQGDLRSILTSKTISYLTPRINDSQFQRNRSFLDGLQQAVHLFNAEYRVTSSGLMKPRWAVDGEPEARDTGIDPVDKSDFLQAAKDLEGSQDLGNQLFCALLRSVGVESRIVCSLQPLPFSSVPKPPTPKKPVRTKIYAMPSGSGLSKQAVETEDTAIGVSKSVGIVPSVRRRLGQPSFAGPSDAIVPKKAKPVPKLVYPVFWVEAFNKAHQKWIAIDPLVTNTVNMPTKLEPPSSYDLGQMTYVIALETDGVARDVTRRYAKAYNAKTRRHRVESSPDGAKWWKKVLRVFRRRGGLLDRDQVEDAELAQKEAREGMPANVLDFKDHPYYALGRHLKRHEVIHPLRQVGKVNAGTAAKPRMEAVYRRQDLQVCKSADKWYRLGREIKEGEQPLKHVPARINRQRSLDPEADDDGSTAPTTALYAPFQTQLYVPPPVEGGRVPKNVYGNLDVYVSSMVPAGGVHIRHDLAQSAAKILRVDYADAVTGFKFQGRHGTAIIEGAVVAQQYAEALQAVITGIEDDIAEAESKERSLVALKAWKRLLTGLRIADRVNNAYGKVPETEGESQEMEEMPPEGQILSSRSVDLNPLPTAGRFTLSELSTTSKPLRPKKRKVIDSDSECDAAPDLDDEDLSYADDGGFAGGFFPEPNATYHEDGISADQSIREGSTAIDHEGSGGFLVDDQPDNGGSGGFLIEDDESGEDGHGFTPDTNETKGMGGGFVHDDEGTDNDFVGERDPTAPLKSASAPASREAHGLTIVRPHEESEHDDETLHTLEAEVFDAEAVVGQTESATTTKRPSKSATDDESDRGSLLSHDPEDDDAEPDWLESD